MAYQVENINESEHIVSFNIEASDVLKAYTREYRAVEAKARINGFRPGHIPKKILLDNYGRDIVLRASDYIVKKALSEYAKDKKTVILEAQDYKKDGNITVGQNYTFSMKVITEPQLVERDISDVKVELVDCKITDADVEHMIGILRKKAATYTQVEDANAVIADDSRVNIDFVGKRDNEPFEGGSAKGFEVDINGGRMIPGFCEQLVGHKAGEQFTINCKFPDDYHVDELKGKEATFDITVNSIETCVVPELDDDFAKLYEVDNVNELRESLKSNITRQAEALVNNKNFDALISAVAEKYKDVSISEILLTENAKNSYLRALHRMFNGNNAMFETLKKSITPAMIQQYYESQKEQIFKMTIMQSIVHLYTDVLDIMNKPYEDILKEIIDKESTAYDDPEEFKKEVYKKGSDYYISYISKARSIILFNLIKEKVQVTTKDISWTELSEGLGNE